MRKRSATAASANPNFIKAYFELKRLRADIEYIERSRRPSRQVSAAGRDARKGEAVRETLRP